jgi:hypothetical protein
MWHNGWLVQDVDLSKVASIFDVIIQLQIRLADLHPCIGRCTFAQYIKGS